MAGANAGWVHCSFLDGDDALLFALERIYCAHSFVAHEMQATRVMKTRKKYFTSIGELFTHSRADFDLSLQICSACERSHSAKVMPQVFSPNRL
jgi:hypothetical protein